MNPTLVVLGFSGLAAAAASLGVLPLIGRDRIPGRWMGWASALAAGMMLGSAYVLAEAGLVRQVLAGAGGALLGILYIHWTHWVLGTGDLDLDDLAPQAGDYAYKVILVGTLHSASEGLAIGVAMALDLSLGVFVAVAMAIHNIPEATVLAAVVRSGGARLGQAAGLAVAVNVSQVLLAVTVFAVVTAAPATLIWMLGFAVGTLMHLVMVELLPQSYREAGPTSIGLVVSVATGIVVLLRGFQ
ncbi:MAG: ZIP family metal transporter [Acidobacteriota bacterium]